MKNGPISFVKRERKRFQISRHAELFIRIQAPFYEAANKTQLLVVK